MACKVLSLLMVFLVAIGAALASGVAQERPRGDAYGVAPGDSEEERGGISVEGRISSGVECPVLITPEGAIYALVGGHDFVRGAYVRVEGQMAEVSFCMQGKGTISVDTIHPIAPPDEDGDPDAPGQVIPD